MTDDEKIIKIYKCIPETGESITYNQLLKETNASKETLSRVLEYLQETLLVERICETGRGRYGKVSYRRLDKFFPFSWANLLADGSQTLKKTKKTHVEDFKYTQTAYILSAFSFIDITILRWMYDYVNDDKKTHAEKVLKGRIDTVLKPMVTQLTLLFEQGTDESVIDLVATNLPSGTPDIKKIKVIKTPEKGEFIPTPIVDKGEPKN